MNPTPRMSIYSMSAGDDGGGGGGGVGGEYVE